MTMKVKDLAAMLNLSPSTVSLVLNNRPGISDATRDKVCTAVRELGYGEMLTKDTPGKKNLLFVVYRKHDAVPNSSPYFSQVFSEIIEGMESQARARGYQLLVSYTDEYTIHEEAMRMKKEEVDGVLILATEMQEAQMDAFAGGSVPIVVVDNYMSHREFDCITINNEQGVHEVVGHFADLGHKHIGYLHVDNSANNFSERYYGFLRAVEYFGLEPDRENLIHIGTSGGEAVYQELKKKLSGREKMPTAFFADNDIIAICAMRVFRELGYRIPEDVSIAGFDNITLSEMMDPPLTSIQIPKHKMGVVAVNTLIDKIRERVEGVIKVEVRTSLVQRESVRRMNGTSVDR